MKDEVESNAELLDEDVAAALLEDGVYVRTLPDGINVFVLRQLLT